MTETISLSSNVAPLGEVKPRLRCAVFSAEPQNHASALLRIVQPLRELVDKVDYVLFAVGGRALPQQGLEAVSRCDVVVVQRLFPCRVNRSILDYILRLGKPVVYETDDLLHDLPREHYLSAYSRENCTLLIEFIRRCDAVTVSTEPLAAAYHEFNSNVHVIQNFLDPKYWMAQDAMPHCARSNSSPLIIGFFGTGTHAPDLALVEEALLMLAEKHRSAVAFRFLGCITPRLAELPGCTFSDQWCTYDRFPKMLHEERIDIGIAPLVDSHLNRCKSDLKWLEYSALRIPAVFSAVEPYARSVRDEVTGLVVPNEPEAWFAALDRLVSDSDLRKSIAEAAHEELRATRTLNTGATLFLDTLRAAASIRPDPGRADRVWDMVMHYENALAEQASRLSKAESDLAWLEGRLPHRIAKGLRRLF